MSKNDSKTAHDQLAIHKEGGLTVYLMEELTDARMRCDQLKRYIAEAVKMVNQSEKRDHLFEVAGNLLYGIPEALFKLDKALDATALAASRLDYEELKQQLKPEKAEELEAVLNEARVRHIDRRSDPANPFKGKTAMRTSKAASQARISDALREVAAAVDAAEIPPSEARIRVRRVLMALSQTAEQAVDAMGPMQADSREQVMEGFKDANPDLSQEELEEIADQWEKNKNVVKEKQADDEAKFSEEDKQSKFEEGKPADPTENMSPEDAKKWKEEHDKNKDKFKSASASLQCDMKSDCKEDVSHVDNKGYVYCKKHGEQRKSSGTPCRAMKPAEIKKLQEGQTIKYRAASEDEQQADEGAEQSKTAGYESVFKG